MQKPLNYSNPVTKKVKNNYKLLSMIILLREVIVKVIFLFAKSRDLISLQIDLTIYSETSAFCLTDDMRSISYADSSFIFLNSSLADSEA